MSVINKWALTTSYKITKQKANRILKICSQTIPVSQPERAVIASDRRERGPAKAGLQSFPSLTMTKRPTPNFRASNKNPPRRIGGAVFILDYFNSWLFFLLNT